MSFPKQFTRNAFTLIELLVVIAIIAILSVVVILTLNPAELLKQSRDAGRVSDMATLNSALGVYAEDVNGGNMGLASTTYLSIPDPSATSTAGDQCQGLSMPAQSTSSGWSYGCQSSSSVRNVNGTGWVPVNLNSISSGAPIGNLPVDPNNGSSTGLYYTYTTNGGTQYEVTSVLESQKYRSQLSSGLTAYPGVDAMGNSLALSGLYNPSGLIGYWPLNEGGGTVANDLSGNNATGSWTGTATGTSGYYSVGRWNQWVGAFDGTTTYVNIPYNAKIKPTSAITIAAWTYLTNSNFAAQPNIVVSPYRTSSGWSSPYGSYLFDINASGQYQFLIAVSGVNYQAKTASSTAVVNAWAFVVGTYDGSNIKVYLNGTLGGTTNQTGLIDYSGGNADVAISSLGKYISSNSGFWPGFIDEVRIYNRALSGAEIAALYNAGK